jgi:signal peptidase II
LNKKVRNYLFLFIVAALLTAFDQWSKAQVRGTLPMGSIWSPWEWLTPYARIVHWKNSGVAFGMFQGMGTVFAVLAAIVSLIIIYYYPRVAGDSWTLKIAMSMQLAGALGNFIDRVTIGYVTDFVSVGNLPVFNVADSCISVGVVILLIYVWLQEKKEKDTIPSPVEPIEEGPVNSATPMAELIESGSPLAEPVEAGQSDASSSPRQARGTGDALAEPVEAGQTDAGFSETKDRQLN